MDNTKEIKTVEVRTLTVYTAGTHVVTESLGEEGTGDQEDRQNFNYRWRDQRKADPTSVLNSGLPNGKPSSIIHLVPE